MSNEQIDIFGDLVEPEKSTYKNYTIIKHENKNQKYYTIKDKNNKNLKSKSIIKYFSNIEDAKKYIDNIDNNLSDNLLLKSNGKNVKSTSLKNLSNDYSGIAYVLKTSSGSYIAFPKGTAYRLNSANLAIFNDIETARNKINYIGDNSIKIQKVEIEKGKIKESLIIDECISKIKEAFSYAGIEEITSQEAYDADVYYEILTELLGIDKYAVNLVLNINGNKLKTYNDILKATTGYEDLSQISF